MMNRKNIRNLILAAILLAAFGLWSVFVSCVDVQAVGPRASEVGFATVNSAFHNLTGVHMTLYTITDWLGLVPIAFVFGFAIMGLVQWVQRHNILEVDYSILVLGGFYIAVLAMYILFEYIVINHRPVLIDGFLEASYPSSTTMLVLCIMPTAIMQLNTRLKWKALRICIAAAISVFVAFVVIGRLISGVHWLSDIIGGVLLSGGLVVLYKTVSELK